MRITARMLWVAARAMMRPNLDLLGISTCRFRVLPSDIDINLHMNNGRFLHAMDVARLDWLLRTGVLQNAVSQHRRFLLCGVMMRYVRELAPFQPYRLSTRLLGWNRKFFYIEQCFEDQHDRVCAIGLVRAAICQKQHIVPAADVVADHGHRMSPPLPCYVRSWIDADVLVRRQARIAEPMLVCAPIEPLVGTADVVALQPCGSLSQTSRVSAEVAEIGPLSNAHESKEYCDISEGCAILIDS